MARSGETAGGGAVFFLVAALGGDNDDTLVSSAMERLEKLVVISCGMAGVVLRLVGFELLSRNSAGFTPSFMSFSRYFARLNLFHLVTFWEILLRISAPRCP
jgi:hypothetical protein